MKLPENENICSLFLFWRMMLSIHDCKGVWRGVDLQLVSFFPLIFQRKVLNCS